MISERPYTFDRVFNVVSDYKISIKNLALKIYYFMGVEPNIVYDDPRPDDVMSFDNISNEDTKAIGMEFMNDFDEGLKKTIDWYRRF